MKIARRWEKIPGFCGTMGAKAREFLNKKWSTVTDVLSESQRWGPGCLLVLKVGDRWCNRWTVGHRTEVGKHDIPEGLSGLRDSSPSSETWAQRKLGPKTGKLTIICHRGNASLLGVHHERSAEPRNLVTL